MTPIMTNAPAFKNIFPDGKTGTYIVVEKFNESIDSHTDLQKIQRSTQSCLIRFEQDSDFNINLQLPRKYEKWEDFAISGIIDQALYKFEVNIDAMGQRINGIFKDNNRYSKHYGEEVVLDYKTQDILDGENV